MQWKRCPVFEKYEWLPVGKFTQRVLSSKTSKSPQSQNICHNKLSFILSPKVTSDYHEGSKSFES